MTPSLGVLTRGWLWLPLPGLTSPVWSPGCFWLLGAGSRPVRPLRSLAPSHSGVCSVRVTVPPYFLAYCGAPWLMALRSAIFTLPLVSRPWTGLCWSQMSLSSVSVCSWFYRASWLAQAPASPICPTSSVLKRSSFGISASVFASSLRDGVTLPGRVCLSPRSERSLFLYLPGVWLESS